MLTAEGDFQIAYSLLGKQKLHVWKCPETPPIIGKMPAAQCGGLGAYEEVRQDGLLSPPAGRIASKGRASTPGRSKVKVKTAKDLEVFVNGFLRPSTRSQLRIGHRADRHMLLPGPLDQGGFTTGMVRMSFVQPGDNNGSINQAHGRVFRSNSAPEILPSQLPARARIWRWASLREPDFFRTRMTPLSCSVQR